MPRSLLPPLLALVPTRYVGRNSGGILDCVACRRTRLYTFWQIPVASCIGMTNLVERYDYMHIHLFVQVCKRAYTIGYPLCRQIHQIVDCTLAVVRLGMAESLTHICSTCGLVHIASHT